MNNKRGDLWIIPDEEVIQQAVFYQEIPFGMEHHTAVQQFIELYQLNIEVEEDNYQQVSCEVAKEGHLLVKGEREVSLLVFYLPERITARQLEWYLFNREQLSTFQKISAFSLEYDQNQNGLVWQRITGEENIMRAITKKSLQKIEHKEGCQNVGKKI